MKTLQYILAAALAVSPVAVGAQTTVDFETPDGYRELSVYDTWPESPFRTGRLQGNVAVVRNPFAQVDKQLGAAPNASHHVLAVQRSRYGSNTFGARIDLAAPFELTPQLRYVHVLIHKPVEGRVMLIGLGKRPERAAQSASTEQFWETSSNRVKAQSWCDAVFPIKGAGGVDIHSLVVVPDCESTHDLKADFAAYIDDIIVNDSPEPRIAYEDYPINYPATAQLTRNDRYTSSVGLTTPSAGEQILPVGQKTDKLLYHDLTDQVFLAKAGEQVQASIGFNATWMHGYIYLDRGHDGRFSALLDGRGLPAEGSDLMAFSYLNGLNSQGAQVREDASLNPLPFTIPKDLPNGFYRMRYKLDWNNASPAGTVDTKNRMDNNGGAFVDVRLNVHAEEVTVRNLGGLNGDVLKADGTKFSTLSIPFGKPLTIRMKPAPKFKIGSLRVRHGYNLEGEPTEHGMRQYAEVTYQADDFVNGSLTIPAAIIDGDVVIEPHFVSIESE